LIEFYAESEILREKEEWATQLLNLGQLSGKRAGNGSKKQKKLFL
jgi:hypothetical protein